MLISIITVVYNNNFAIKDCIQSVLNQTYNEIEYIVIDGGSTDGTLDSINVFKDRISCYISEKDKGLYDALNKGIKQATGDVIGILHSDDLFYEPDIVTKIVHAFENSNADLVYGNGLYVDKADVENVRRIYRAKPFNKNYLNFGWIPLHTTIFVKKELFELYGLYDTKYCIASDYEISLRWFTNPGIKTFFLNTWVVKMRLGGKSTSAKLQKKKSTEDLDIIRRYKLWGIITLCFKIARKIPQYISPCIVKYK